MQSPPQPSSRQSPQPLPQPPLQSSPPARFAQFSLFGAEIADLAVDDLDGVLLGGGQWVRLGGTARLSVVVADRWRADAIAAVFTELGLGAEIVTAEGGVAVRTSFVSTLQPHAQRWTRGANQVPPSSLSLTANGLRIWAIVAGRRDAEGYLLGTDAPDDVTHLAGGAQLARLGVAAVSIAGRSAPGWRISSSKRLRRLAELLGQQPPDSGPDWPA
jgi:hypothetical protein